jgi:ribosome-associated protein
MQFVGKLMRQLEEPDLERIRAALTEHGRGPAGDTLALHQTEQWRERMISDDDAFGAWITRYPLTDGQQLRALIRQARKDALPTQAGETPRHGKAYRELFQMLREQMSAIPDNDDTLSAHVQPTSLT